MEETNAYEFARKYNVKLKILGHEYRKFFKNDKEKRFVFKCQLSRNRKRYTFLFGQSIMNDCKEPTIYDVLCCLNKENESFEDFCHNFGYNEDSIKDYNIWKACIKEYKALKRLFPEENVFNELCMIW